jgi:hypothetical protein
LGGFFRRLAKMPHKDIKFFGGVDNKTVPEEKKDVFGYFKSKIFLYFFLFILLT